jgi:3-methyladenine DNA glycosylase AlkD
MEFQVNSDEEKARGQKTYLKNKFKFFGLTSPIRRPIQKLFLVKQYLPPKDTTEEVIKFLWQKPEREFQYFHKNFFRNIKSNLKKRHSIN